MYELLWFTICSLHTIERSLDLFLFRNPGANIFFFTSLSYLTLEILFYLTHIITIPSIIFFMRFVYIYFDFSFSLSSGQQSLIRWSLVRALLLVLIEIKIALPDK